MMLPAHHAISSLRTLPDGCLHQRIEPMQESRAILFPDRWRSAGHHAALAQAREKLEATAARLRQRGLTVDVAVVSDTVPAHAILEWAASNPVDVIALATHGRGGWSRLALGSVADKVLRGAAVPLLLYRPHV